MWLFRLSKRKSVLNVSLIRVLPSLTVPILFKDFVSPFQFFGDVKWLPRSQCLVEYVSERHGGGGETVLKGRDGVARTGNNFSHGAESKAKIMAVALHRENNPPWETFVRGAEMEKLSSGEKAENNNTHLRPSSEDRLRQSNGARLASFSLATTLRPSGCCACY